MKTRILHSSIAAALSVCAFQSPLVSSGVAADTAPGTPVDGPSRQQKEQLERDQVFPAPSPAERIRDFKWAPGPGGTTVNGASSSVTTNSDGTATVTIEVNGKKDTRTFKLNEDQPFTLKMQEGLGGDKSPKPGEKETWIGIGVGGAVSEEVRAQLPIQQGEGVTVLHVASGSPAEKAGLAQHDILVRLDDQVLVDGDQFKKLVRMRKPGDAVKIGYFRKGERKDASVTLTEHEARLESTDVLRLITDPDKWNLKGVPPEKWQERLQILREKSEVLRDRLKDAKDKFPGVVIDKKAFVLGLDGTVKKIEGELQNVEGIVKNIREQLENANISKETIEEVRKAVEGVLDKTGDAARKAAVEAIIEFRSKREAEKNTVEPPKLDAPAQPVPPAPPIYKPQ